MAAKLYGGESSSVVVLLLILFAGIASSADLPASSPPIPGPELAPTDTPGSPPSPPPASSPPSPPSPPPEADAPSPTPDISPTPDSPIPPPADDGPMPPPAPTPAPSPSDVSDVTHSGANDEADAEKSSGGNGARTAGIVVGVLAAVCVVGVGGFVYKKRRDNMRRSQYSYATRRDMI